MDLKYNWIYLKFDLILNILLNFTYAKYNFKLIFFFMSPLLLGSISELGSLNLIRKSNSLPYYNHTTIKAIICMHFGWNIVTEVEIPT